MFDPSKIKGRETNIELPASLETGEVGPLAEIVFKLLINKDKFSSKGPSLFTGSDYSDKWQRF
ncbi:hypothetical protein [Pseudomonas sp. W2Aug9]|uniref:hypothetical protein n=1 Tax=Pseudomonas sp. W2Aug9 TaxID=1215242 RepID=UPI002004B301|nr:hypothetical protein [Pseudomonas sp. W2Aug9]MCK3826943.1 hypothetical protein [Pseudomonas sp. W2Aug9]